MSDNSDPASGYTFEPLPGFASYEEEATFWDTHDLDYYADKEPPYDDVPEELLYPVDLLSDFEMHARLEILAERQDTDVQDLISTWMEENTSAIRLPKNVSIVRSDAAT